jgi:hypothetical protein
MRHLLEDLGMFLCGLAVALLTVSVTRLGSNAFALFQLPIVCLVLAVFFLKENRLAAFAIGLGLGLDAVSSYAFFTWTVVISSTTLAGWWLSKTVLTNRSLPSLMLLGAAMRLVYFLFELCFSRISGLVGGTVWYLITGINPVRVLEAFGLEMLFLLVFFTIHVRVRGERARMLTHL